MAPHILWLAALDTPSRRPYDDDLELTMSLSGNANLTAGD